MNVQLTKGLSQEEKERFEESKKLATTYREVCLNYVDAQIELIRKQRLSREIFDVFNYDKRMLALNAEEKSLMKLRKLFQD